MYRKFQADSIFTGSELLDESHVLLTHPDGTIIEIVPHGEAGDDIEKMKGIISPGFINCHCHIELSFLKDKIPEHTGLVDFVLSVLANRDADPAIKLGAMQAGAEELYHSGTMAIGDICNDALSLQLKKNSPLHWINFIEVSGFVNSTAQQRFNTALQIAKAFSELPFPYAIVPHAPYSVSRNLFKLINEYASPLISIHNQESADEDELYLSKSGAFLKLYDKLGIDIAGFNPTGKSSLHSWLPHFTHQQKIISVHNTFISQADIDIANSLTYCICINANLYIENKLPAIEMLMNNNCHIVVGTDSYASNHQLNMLEELKTIQKNFPTIDTSTILKWATKNGAEALGISEHFGSFDKGKKPGIILIDEMQSLRFAQSSKVKRL